jgi:mannosyl-3-phosphoglycerate phosphatase
MLVFITDLDGTLLDADHSCAAALPALERLQRLRVPLVFCTSKTRAEVEAIRRRLNNRDPFIVENGGALYVPDGALPLELNSPTRRGGCAVVEFGDHYPKLIRSLRRASAESGCAVHGFHQMSVEDISRCCQMPPEAARLAKQREYDEPFKILDGDPPKLLAAIEKQKKRWTRGGCFYHILGANDKAHCVNLLIHYYREAFGNVTTVGLGDGPNDVGFLNLVDFPLVLESAASEELAAAIPRAQLCRYGGGPEAWNRGVLNALDRHFGSELQVAGAAAEPGACPDAAGP